MGMSFDPVQPPRLNLAQARILVDIARRASGVAVAEEKLGFVELRVSRRLRDLDCPCYAAYIDYLQGPDSAEETRRLVEALTTHTTAFFREKGHYDWLEREGLPALVARGAGRERPLVIWSAACSLGSEMWTAAIVVERYARNVPGGLRWEVVGTDVSRSILRRAAHAVFTEEETAGMPDDMRRAYMMRARGGRPLYRVAPELRARARLAWANLVHLDRALELCADVAFLRNVLIYFEAADQRRAVANVLERLRPGGYLLTGHSESLAEPPAGLRALGASIYRKD